MRRFYLLSIIVIVLAAFLLGNGIVKNSYADKGKASVTKLIQMSQKCVQNGKWNEAKKYAKKAVQTNPNSATAWDNYDKVILGASQASGESDSEEGALEGC